MIWKPHVTVAAVVQRAGRYLLVEEHTAEGVRFNQPAGHLDPGESLLAASVRETLEETAYHFTPTHLLGVYLWPRPDREVTYLRFAFVGAVLEQPAQSPLDDGILAAHWLTPEQIWACRAQHRSPLVWQCIQDHQAGQCASLDVLRYYE